MAIDSSSRDKPYISCYSKPKSIELPHIVDVVGVLTEQIDVEHARNYWKVLKQRLKKEENETVTNCNGLKYNSNVNH